MPCNIDFSLNCIENLNVFKQNPKLLIKLKQNTAEDNYYETHQLYKTIHFRCINNGLVDESIELIYNGIVYFAKKKQLHCIFDLAKVFVETLKKSSNTTPSAVNSDLVQQIKFIHSALSEGSEEQNEFTVAILKWSGALFTKLGTVKTINQENSLNVYQKNFGHVSLHREMAHNLWNEKNYVKARYHFLHSADGESFSSMMIECNLKYGFPSETDLSLTQVVLQFLCLRNLETATQFFNHFKSNHPFLADKQKDFPPLINFLNFLFISIKKSEVNLFNILIDLYKPSLDRDISFFDYLDRIGQYFFNLKPKKAEKENMLGNLMRMLTSPGTNSNDPSTASNSSNSNNINISSINNFFANNNNEDDDNDWNSTKEEDIEDNDLLD